MCPNPHHVLMDILCQSFAVMVPGQGVHFLNDLSGSDALYYCVVDDDKCVSGLGPPEIHNLISLAFANLQDKVAGFAPVHTVFYLPPLEGIIVITDKAHYCYVIHKLHKVACSRLPALTQPRSTRPPLPRPAGPQSRTKRISQLFLRGRSNSDRDRAVGEREREVWAHSAAPSSHHYLPVASSSAPGLIKIYGDAFSSGANYRSLLANIHSTSRQLIAQVITRYTEREREETEDAGVRCRRSRMSSGGGLEEAERGHRGRNTELRRSISDMNLSLRRRQGNHLSNEARSTGNQPNNSGGAQDRKSIVSMINPQPVEVRASRAEAKVGWTNQPADDEKDYSNCDLEVMSQSLILPPTDRPYFLLLQGFDQSKARHANR
ncbi:hypothetical protein GOODEAATRI_004806 [Goodea atripinnis]|uniref:Uncharacterized protein n=1 Tax=Goodea atripinnis TaxID=208336 RepID=A0ABV0PL32_9TELE